MFNQITAIMKSIFPILILAFFFHSCSLEKKSEFETFVSDSYNSDLEEIDDSETKSLLKRRRAKISEVPINPQATEVELPKWITDKQYVTENVDAIKYEPSVLIGAIVRKYEDSSFVVFTASNIRKGDVIPKLEVIENPVNFYERTFSNNAKVNGSFAIGSINILSNQALRIAYTETNYLVAKETDNDLKAKLKAEILENRSANKSDWAFVRGIVTLDCSYTMFMDMGGDVAANASFVSVGAQLYQKSSETNNFRLISIDLEPLWLE